MVTQLLDEDPRTLGAYRLTGRLGAGGQGVVYLGQASDGGSVAVKLLHSKWIADPAARSRFAREVAAARRVSGFCTARVLAADTAGPQPHIVSEYIAGPSLTQVVRRDGPRSGGALQALAVGTATALAVIHQTGVVHRDFKPGNVLLGPDGPRVIDFGIARALDGGPSATNRVIGSPAYMAPEQARGESVGPAVDMFAWGCTIVFAATGRPPFGDDTVPAVLFRIATAEPDLSGLPENLRGVVADCLRKNPAERPAPQQVLLRLLGEAPGTPPAAVLAHGGQAAALAPYRPTRLSRRDRRIAGALGVVTLIAIAVGAAAWVLRPDPAPGPSTGPVNIGSANTVAASPTSAAAGTTIPASYGGNWHGSVDMARAESEETEGTRGSGPDDRTVRFLLPAGATSGRFEMPTRRCSGTLRVVRAEPQQLTVEAHAETDPGRLCTTDQPFTLTPSDHESLTLAPGDTGQGAGAGSLYKERNGQERAPQRLDGTWSGTLPSDDKRKVTLKLDGGATGVAGTVAYPDKNCSGLLGIMFGDDDSMSGIEDFGRNRERCEYNGYYQFTVNNDGSVIMRYTAVDSSRRDVPLRRVN